MGWTYKRNKDDNAFLYFCWDCFDYIVPVFVCAGAYYLAIAHLLGNMGVEYYCKYADSENQKEEKMKETIYSIIQWHAETFPDATLEGQLEKYQEELQEFIATDYKDAEELADMFIVACGIARFDLWEGSFYIHDVYEWFDEDATISWDDLFKAVSEKMTINRQRTWHKEEGLYKHDK